MTTPTNRRSFLSRAAKTTGFAALTAGLPKGWVGSAYASDAPETPDMKFGIIALTDCSPHRHRAREGLLQKVRHQFHGHQRRELGRDPRLAEQRRHPGHAHAHRHADRLHAWASRGAPKKPMVIPWLLNRNGQAITLKKELQGQVSKDDPKALKPLVDEAKSRGVRR